MEVAFGVLGPVSAWDGAGDTIVLKGPRHRAVLARLLVARRRVVPVTRLAEDLWEDPPPGAVGAVRTFVAALRRALEPERPPRAPARLLVTEGPGYALRAEPGAVDAWRFEQAVADAAALPPGRELARLTEALGWWRGPAYAEFTAEEWIRAERSRLAELRLHAVERLAGARLALGRAAEAVADLDAHVAGHPWREDAWRLLALALYRAGRQGDALAVLRRARALLAEQLGVDPGPVLRRLEADILRHAPGLDPGPAPAESAARVWAQSAAAYDRAVPYGARARLESAVDLLRTLAVTGGGGLQDARRHRVAAVAAAEELGDPELTARVIGAYDVPAIWTRLDDPPQAARIVAAAERALAALPSRTPEAVRARLLATIAVESRGTRAARGAEAAREAERIARRLDDPALLAFALNGVFMQSFHRTGLAPRRDAVGAELVDLSARHGLVVFEALGHLVRLQARSALADFAGADAHAAAADRLAERHELPLLGVFTRWYRALRLDAAQGAPYGEAEAAYREAAAHLDGAGMPGLEHGLPALALLCLRLRHAPPGRTGGGAGRGSGPAVRSALRDTLRDTRGGTGWGTGWGTGADADWGPYEPWARPLVLLAGGRAAEAATALRAVPDPAPGLLAEALWCLAARAAVAVGDRRVMARARAALAPEAAELDGAGSALLPAGPVSAHLAALDAALAGPEGP
ncbi:BTAD domain-containing putative transcriptional regulator [Planomonospora alba]|uniref:BTAD domain-containing putative transcriptional regulator n=1 Tax=Planomonospora alba TaxID=161354 RepID=A0ABP6NND9_9ACTN